jgi:hypothetical protein
MLTSLSTKSKKTIPPSQAQKVRTNPRYNVEFVCRFGKEIIRAQQN